MRLRSQIAAIVFALAASQLSAAVSLVGQVGRLFRSDTTTQVPVGSVAILVADTDKATSPGLVNPLGTTLRVGSTLGGASGDLIVGVYQASDLGGGIIGADLGGTTLNYTGALTAGTDLWLVWFPGISAVGSQVGGAEPFGAYRSDTIDTASQSTIAFVTPPDGSTSTLNAYAASTGYGLATDAQLSATQVTSAPVATRGIYFGTFTSGGHWALYVRADGTATYLAYLPSRGSAMVVNLTVGLGGTFSAAGTEAKSLAAVSALAVAGPESPVRRAAAAASFTLTGQIDANGAVTGQLAGLGETFTGTIDTATASVPAGFYQTAALNAASGSTLAIVGPSGQAVVVTTGTANGGAAGTVNASGQFTASDSNGGQFVLSINQAAQTVSATFTPTGSATPVSYAGLPDGVASTTRVVNLSVRSAAGTGSETLIVGFVVNGAGNKSLLVRGVGPAIKQYVSTALTDPRMRLLNAQGTELEASNDWDSSLQSAMTNLGASSLAPGSKDAAILRAIPGGVYSFHVYANDGGTGVALAELYDADLAATSAQVVNISARTQVGTGSDILIAGFVVTGNAPKTLLIRGQGPSLAGVAGALADPQLYLFDNQNHILATNDNWGGTAALKTAFATVGAGALASDTSKDAALLVTLQPGVYSAQVSGVNSTTGVALVEIFLLP